MSSGAKLAEQLRSATVDWFPRLRLYRTLFVNRWHAAITVGEKLNNSSIGERAEHINHAASLSEYLWRFGAFNENPNGTERIDINAHPSPDNGLHHIFKQLDPYDQKVARTAVHYTIWKFGRYHIDSKAMEDLVNSELKSLTPEIQKKVVNVANGIRKLQERMLPFYLDMQYVPSIYLDQRVFKNSRNFPITAPIFSTDLNKNGKISVGQDNVPVQGDPILAVHKAFGRNIYFPHPRGPTSRIACGSSDRVSSRMHSSNTDFSRSRPAICGGILPAPGLNGFVAQFLIMFGPDSTAAES